MSEFENAVRFNLERMIRDSRTFLSPDQQKKLAQYLTYKMMIADWMDSEPVMPPEWPKEFYRSRTIPPNTYIWAFNCVEDAWRSGLRTVGLGLCHVDDWRPGLPINTKSFAIGFGSLFTFAVFGEVDVDLQFHSPGAFRLWPPTGQMLAWPMRYVISSDQAEFVARTLHRVQRHPNAIHRSLS